MQPPISVIIFVRNAASTIERALASVIEQQVPGLELIVLDAGSTDGTVEVIRRYAEHIVCGAVRPTAVRRRPSMKGWSARRAR